MQIAAFSNLLHTTITSSIPADFFRHRNHDRIIDPGPTNSARLSNLPKSADPLPPTFPWTPSTQPVINRLATEIKPLSLNHRPGRAF